MHDPHPSKSDLLDLMRRIGMHDRIEQAQREPPETIDLARDGELLAALGVGIHGAVNRLGACSHRRTALDAAPRNNASSLRTADRPVAPTTERTSDA